MITLKVDGVNTPEMSVDIQNEGELEKFLLTVGYSMVEMTKALGEDGTVEEKKEVCLRMLDTIKSAVYAKMRAEGIIPKDEVSLSEIM